MQDQCLEINYKETYLGETARRLQERDLNHAGKGRESNLVKIVRTQLIQQYI